MIKFSNFVFIQLKKLNFCCTIDWILTKPFEIQVSVNWKSELGPSNFKLGGVWKQT